MGIQFSIFIRIFQKSIGMPMPGLIGGPAIGNKIQSNTGDQSNKIDHFHQTFDTIEEAGSNR